MPRRPESDDVAAIAEQFRPLADPQPAYETLVVDDLPPEVDASRIGPPYGDRWKIENAFQDAATTLRAEIDTVAYPAAALMTFCLALLIFNVLRLRKRRSPTRTPKRSKGRPAAAATRLRTLVGTPSGNGEAPSWNRGTPGRNGRLRDVRSGRPDRRFPGSRRRIICLTRSAGPTTACCWRSRIRTCGRRSERRRPR
jgi:hypothetical protein